VPSLGPHRSSGLVERWILWQINLMTTKTVELEVDAVARLEAAKWSADETFSSVVLRAHFPGKPHLARELLDDFQRRAGFSPLNEEALERLAESQRNPTCSPSHWD